MGQDAQKQLTNKVQIQDQAAYYTQLYKNGLKCLLDEDYSAADQIQLTQCIRKLNQTQRIAFWKHIQEQDTTYSKSVRQLKYFLKKGYQRVLYNDKLTTKDKQYIRKYCMLHPDLIPVQQKNNRKIVLRILPRQKTIFSRSPRLCLQSICRQM
ncbi:Hypothetical_protein [Hexamita inflata]|uniref:Hypothetical_protein n=1 Tax=Hexamita inflata TaxID=28002 RepID=A0AA86TAZ5_9EUKA|nr:Hypothetical protein HINF_LOCUS706 [Hexamita inflata]CAI9956738.1 Hypothetical protein HINF_LOCUS44383 [Hexamita inflata]